MDNVAGWRGIIDIGSHQYDVITYSGSYMDDVDNVSTPYVADNNVIIRASDGRLDATFGIVHNIDRSIEGRECLTSY